MSRYLASRIGQALIVLWAAFTASFILLQALPGDAILIKFLNPELGLGPEQIADIRASYGADIPLTAQYLHTILNFLSGNFALVSRSVRRNSPSRSRLFRRCSPGRGCAPSFSPCRPCSSRPRSSGWEFC